MKYRTAKEIISNIKHYSNIEEDLIVFRKPYNRSITFKMKDGTTKNFRMKDCSYVSMSNYGFLFIYDKPYEIIPVHLNNVDDITVL